MTEDNIENKKYPKNTYGWLVEKAKEYGCPYTNIGQVTKWLLENRAIKDNRINYGQLLDKAKKDGFNNVRDWQNWKIEKTKENIFYKNLEKNHGEDFAKWAKQNENIVPKWCLNTGHKNTNEYYREHKWAKGKCLPASDNKDCSAYFGEYIGENYVSRLFEDVKRMPPGNLGFDWICKKGMKIDHKASCTIQRHNSYYFEFTIRYNNIPDYFILSAWDNRDSLEPLHIWIIHKDEIIRGKKFWRRETLIITNKPKYLIEFARYETKDKLCVLKKLCEDLKEDI